MLGRWLGKRESESKPDSPRNERADNRPAVGLCFNYERGLGFTSEGLFDVGLDSILATLAELHLRATFLCPAKLCETAPDHLGRISAAGHELAALGYADESPRELADDAIKQLVYSCRNAFGRRGYHPIGFRAPQSHWDQRLCEELLRQDFRYSAEHDHAKKPYVVVPGSPPLIRMPLRTDDRGLRGSDDRYDLTVSKHLRVLRKAIQSGHFVTVCFHPWILAEDRQRMEHWRSWVEAAVRAGAMVGALEDLAPKAEQSIANIGSPDHAKPE